MRCFFLSVTRAGRLSRRCLAGIPDDVTLSLPLTADEGDTQIVGQSVQDLYSCPLVLLCSFSNHKSYGSGA